MGKEAEHRRRSEGKGGRDASDEDTKDYPTFSFLVIIPQVA